MKHIERLAYKPTPTAIVATSMLYLLSRSRPQVAGATPESKPASLTNRKGPAFFEEMSRQYGK